MNGDPNYADSWHDICGYARLVELDLEATEPHREVNNRLEMGYTRHDAIIVTSYRREAIEEAATKAREYGLEVLGPSTQTINGFRTLLVCPDGSIEGWQESDDFDDRRAKYLEYLNNAQHADGSSWLSWVALAYGNDDRTAEITAHAWQTLES
jgi:hypothetical protein